MRGGWAQCPFAATQCTAWLGADSSAVCTLPADLLAVMPHSIQPALYRSPHARWVSPAAPSRWAIASGVIAHNVASGSIPATADSVQSWRESIPILCYVETGLFAGMFCSGLFRCCDCCGR